MEIKKRLKNFGYVNILKITIVLSIIIFLLNLIGDIYIYSVYSTIEEILLDNILYFLFTFIGIFINVFIFTSFYIYFKESFPKSLNKKKLILMLVILLLAYNFYDVLGNFRDFLRIHHSLNLTGNPLANIFTVATGIPDIRYVYFRFFFNIFNILVLGNGIPQLHKMIIKENNL